MREREGRKLRRLPARPTNRKCSRWRDEQQQRDAIEVERVKRQALEAVSEYAAELETQQNLGAKNEHPSFVEGSLDEYGKSHLEPTIAARRSVSVRLTITQMLTEARVVLPGVQ